MFRFWGDDSWRRAADAEDNQHDLFSGPKLIKKDNIAVVTAFRKSLQEVGGFKCVQEPLPTKNSNNAVIYYLFFASPKDVAQRIIEDIFAKYVQTSHLPNNEIESPAHAWNATCIGAYTEKHDHNQAVRKHCKEPFGGTISLELCLNQNLIPENK
jgi:hypothetical protein